MSETTGPMSDQTTGDVAAIMREVVAYGHEVAAVRIVNTTERRDAAYAVVERVLRKLADDRDRWRTDSERLAEALRVMCCPIADDRCEHSRVAQEAVLQHDLAHDEENA